MRLQAVDQNSRGGTADFTLDDSADSTTTTYTITA